MNIRKYTGQDVFVNDGTGWQSLGTTVCVGFSFKEYDPSRLLEPGWRIPQEVIAAIRSAEAEIGCDAVSHYIKMGESIHNLILDNINFSPFPLHKIPGYFLGYKLEFDIENPWQMSIIPKDVRNDTTD